MLLQLEALSKSESEIDKDKFVNWARHEYKKLKPLIVTTGFEGRASIERPKNVCSN